MKKIMDFMTNRFAPKVNKIVKNPWIASIQDSIMTALPLVFVGSLITIISLLKNIFKNMPDFSLISTFSFGMFGLIVAFLIPYYLMEKKKNHSAKLISGATSLVLFLMLISPSLVNEGEITFTLSRFGASGMFLSIITGLFVAGVMNFAAKHSLFKEDTPIPDFVVGWFNSLLPITFILIVGWLITFQFQIDFFEVVIWVFSPLAKIVQSYPGFVLSVFIPVFLYTFGISGWVMMPVVYPVYMAGLAENSELVGKGMDAINIATQETCYAFSSMGGIGTTLALAVMMVFLTKSAQLKAIGKATIIPSIFNINEPLVFGAPIAFNPYLMIPMWINAILVPSIAYGAMYFGFVNIPSETFLLWYMPYPFTSYLATQDFRAVILAIVIFVITWFVFLPFLRAYDNSLLKKEKEAFQNKS
ncbi:PTS sugar transporter subunit IIC [Listeria fleischmannii]|jgi:PTS system cellobiose-specific IIC component|uniref:Permease IIC component n=1 Tax=Listeria fleischmannii TaxID=1069827 RepID=A0A841YBP0_9LIST|nr:PTS transporter subunit EIIC [Listeria fleischmannii]MBC1397702.1 PTS sugar transporter subunit IIC [Listeria fleischmannii]MBC1417648.1 PTS sugar transporter subunit IIC [Listeria fleischmannii]MBC1426757.1 PTS sugar transporter subunit IIC [Listeria fleischmannii]STY33785.1 PTS system oligo-beta-mannoside-specific EIIC component [Listeria fleischmannii subsp. coloradonensis]